MEEYEVDITNEDMGEIITMIRVQHCRLHKEPFCKMIGISVDTLDKSEEGKGMHLFSTIKKINQNVPGVEITFNVRMKKGD